MSRAARHAFIPVDPAALILEVMSDGRERTLNDISMRIRIPVDAIRDTMRTMVRNGYLQSEQLPRQGVITIYWKPQA